MLAKILISLLFTAFAHSATLRNGAQIPYYATVCHRTDPELDDCLKGSIETLLRKIAKRGIEQADLPSLDPLVIKELSGGFKGQGYDFNHILRNTSLTGLGNIQIYGVRADLMDPESITIELDLRIPDIKVKGKYKVQGIISTISLGGRGPYSVNMTDIGGTLKIGAHLVTQDHVSYMKVHKMDIAPTIGSMELNFANIIDGNPALSEATNMFFNNFWLPAYEGLLPYSMEMFDKVLRQIANRALLNIPYEQLIPK